MPALIRFMLKNFTVGAMIGWAYKFGDVYSRTYRQKEEAMAAARRAAQMQEVPTAKVIDGAAPPSIAAVAGERFE